MGKTVAISDDIHILLVKTQTEIFEKSRATVRIADITNLAIECGINRAREIYGINKPVEIPTRNNKKPKIIEDNVDVIQN